MSDVWQQIATEWIMSVFDWKFVNIPVGFVILTTSVAANDTNFVKMSFPFQEWLDVPQFPEPDLYVSTSQQNNTHIMLYYNFHVEIPGLIRLYFSLIPSLWSYIFHEKIWNL